jgi:hypothetical protein
MGTGMSQTKGNQKIADRDPTIDNWQERAAVERRTDQDKRKKNSKKYFVLGGKERRAGKERRQSEERRDRWLRVGKWRSESVFEE